MPKPVANVLGGANVVASNSTSAESPWDTFDADVTVTRTTPSDRPAVRDHRLVFMYHKHSQRSSSGGWTLAINFLDADPRMVTRSGNPLPLALGRLELDDKGVVVKFEDAKGNSVTLPAKAAEVLADLKANAMKNDGRSNLHFPQSATGSATPHSASQLSRGPALVNSRLHGQLNSSLAAYFGTPSHADGRARYLRQTGSSLTEVIVDEASGAISEGGITGLMAHAAYPAQWQTIRDAQYWSIFSA